ncbi:MAG: heat-inducible transcription repressor HrcA [Caldithrix sp.]|nr:heat-inducible transcription repressor HrcA [Caldithrix sp.]
MDVLNKREKTILERIVELYVLTAMPVGSTQISQLAGVDLKPASVRRIMAILEERGYLYQPHTSAGRIPTTKGYRLYVDHLINPVRIKGAEARLIIETINSYDGDLDQFLNRITGVLAKISHQLGISVKPKFYQSIFERIELFTISSERIMAVVMGKDGQAKNFLIETKDRVQPEKLDRIKETINKRFRGKTLEEIKQSFSHVMRDLYSERSGLVKLFSKMAERMFDFSRYENYTLNGTRYILDQPEFTDINQFSTLISLLEDKNIIIYFMGKREQPPGIRVTIGDEHTENQIQTCSVITSTYKIGDVAGVLGLIGPTRMAYHKIIPLVDFTATAITERINTVS